MPHVSQPQLYPASGNVPSAASEPMRQGHELNTPSCGLANPRATRRRRRRGFELIELLVVIAIIAVLIGLLLPGVEKESVEGWVKSTMPAPVTQRVGGIMGFK